MQINVFEPIECGETLPVNNVHAVSVSMPKLQDVIDYEEGFGEGFERIKSGYPRFILHPYLKLLASHIKKKYKICDLYEVVLLSSKKAVQLVSDKYYIHNKIEIDEPFGVILVQNGTSQLQKVLMFIQHVGCNLSSRLAEKYLYKVGLISSLHEETLDDSPDSEDVIKQELSDAYNEPKENICLAPSGMNAIYAITRGLKSIQQRNGRTILLQLGWLYLDTMNIVSHHYNQTKVFKDIKKLDFLEKYLKEDGLKIAAIITEIPTNPLLECVDIKRLSCLCKKYNIPLVVDTTMATPYNIDIKKYADIYVESLTKFACGTADVLMGAMILNGNSKISHMTEEFFKHCDYVYEQDIKRMAYQIKNYKHRVKKVSLNTKKLVQYLENCSYVKKVFHCETTSNKTNFEMVKKDEYSFVGVISLEFNKNFDEVYDKLNFAKGPSLGTEFTLLMPYTYLAHYDYITASNSEEILGEIGLSKDLLRVSVGIEDIDSTINEFKRLED